jgi:hypothetical protein
VLPKRIFSSTAQGFPQDKLSASQKLLSSCNRVTIAITMLITSELEFLMIREKIDPGMQKFQADLLQSTRDMKAGRAGRIHRVEITSAAQSRIKTGLFQTSIAQPNSDQKKQNSNSRQSQ